MMMMLTKNKNDFATLKDEYCSEEIFEEKDSSYLDNDVNKDLVDMIFNTGMFISLSNNTTFSKNDLARSLFWSTAWF